MKNIFKSIKWVLGRTSLRNFMIFGRTRYMHHLTKFYSKFGIVFKKPLARFIAFDVYFDKSDSIFIGANTTISSGTLLLTHDYSIDYGMIATKIDRKGSEHSIRKPITIGDNCFIGQKVIVLPGVKIGNNVIIGAGSVVTKDIPDNVVATGNPAKIIETIQEMTKKRIKRDDQYLH